MSTFKYKHVYVSTGLTSLAKIIIAMEERVIPPNLHYKNPNPEIPGLTDGSLKVVSECTKWNGGLVSMNSFGFGGANVHCVYRYINFFFWKNKPKFIKFPNSQ